MMNFPNIFSRKKENIKRNRKKILMEKLNPSKTEGSVFKLWGRILGLFFYIDASLTYFFMDEKGEKTT